MKDPYALRYEYIIRRAYNIGRTMEQGAEADIYDGLAGRSHHKEEQYEYGVRASQISVYIGNAIRKVLIDKTDILSIEQKEKLEECLSDLYSPDINIINKVIDITDEIFNSISLFPK